MKKLASLNSHIVRDAECHATLKDNQTVVRVHVSLAGGGTPGRQYATGTWEYAILLRAVGGWQVIASGTDIVTNTPKSHGQVVAMIREQYGDGFHYILPERYVIAGGGERTACILREDSATSYCGAQVKSPAVFDTSAPGHVTQHHIACTDTYRAEHWGRTPVEGT